MRISGSTSCKLIAEADGAAALVGADAAEQARDIELVGKPSVHQAIEIGPVGLDLDPPEPFRPGGAGRGELALDRLDLGRRGGGERRRAVARLPEDDGDLRFRARREFDLGGEGGDAPAVVALRTVGAAGLDQRRRVDVAPGPAEEARPHGLGRRIGEAGGGERRPALEIVARVLEQQRRADGLGLQLAEAFVGAFVERDVEERRDAQAEMATAEIAQRDEPHVAGIIGRDEDVVIHRQIAAPLGEMRNAGLVGRHVFGVLALERREADRIGLAGVDVADIDDLARQRRRRALEAERRQTVVTRVAHRRIDFAVIARRPSRPRS